MPGILIPSLDPIDTLQSTDLFLVCRPGIDDFKATTLQVASQLGVPAIYGLDNRTGLIAADGSAITLYTATAANQLYRITADIFATTTVAGTASYTIQWTENSTTQTLVVTSTTVNNNGSANTLIRPDNGTNITGQLTFSAASGTFTVAGLIERLV